MRSFLAVALICCSTTIAFGEEAYQQTANELGRCQGLVARSIIDAGRRIAPDTVDDLLKQKCGDLEEREEKEFLDFVSRQLGRTLTDEERAETFMRIVAELLTDHTRGGMRRSLVDAYKSAIINRK
jgi:hypothetical protein